MFTTTKILAVIASVLLLLSTGGNAHNVITYPGWRGDNLITNDTFPYGMQWTYPCEYQLFLALLFTTSPRGSREAERAETPSCAASKHCISRSQVFSPKHHSSISLSAYLQLPSLFRASLTFPLRRRCPHNAKPHQMAHPRWSHRCTARLVPRSRHSLLLHEHGVRLQRTGRWTPKHVFPHGPRIPNHRAQQESLPRNILSSSSPITSEYHGERGG
jgi:hypothetical protein